MIVTKDSSIVTDHINAQSEIFFYSIIIIIIKTSSTGPNGKNKIVYKFLSQLHKHLRLGKLENKLIEATNY